MRALVGFVFLVLLASSTEAQTGAASGTWQNVSFGPEGPAVAGSLVSAVVAGPEGSVFASGTFRVVGGTFADQIARWDGEDWHPLGKGLDFYASDLAAGPGGALYAVGSFRRAGDVAVNSFAAWDGTAWRPFGGGPTNDGRDRAGAVAVGLVV